MLTARNLAFVDASLPELASLLAGLPAHFQVHLMPSNQDGMQFMAQTLVGRSNIESLHLLCHGQPGQLQMGSETLVRAKLAHYRNALDVLSDAMAEDGEWLIYACEVAQGSTGQSFVEALRLMTGLKVAAASHKVGSSAFGGSWTLDNTTTTLRSALSIPQWQGVLINTPPTLDATKSPTLGKLNSYATQTPPVNGSTSGAVLVSSLIDSGGTLNNFSDVDTGTAPGIAITGVKSGASLYYSTDAGAHWNEVGSVNALSARVLYADANTWVYYAPAATNTPSGIVSDAITFKAWDQSGGFVNGQSAVNTVGGLSSSIVNTFKSTGQAISVAIKGSDILIADYSSLKIINIAIKTQLISTVNEQTSTVFVNGNYAYVTNNAYFKVFDITNSAKPKQVASLVDGNAYLDMAFNGNFAFFSGGPKKFQIVDITSPSAPKVISQYNTPGTPMGIAISADGNTAYVADREFGLQIIDIRNKTAPALLAGYSNYITNPGTQNDIALSADGNTVFIVQDKNLYIFDVHIKTAPVQISSYDFGSACYEIALQNNYAYVAAGTSGIQVLDISNLVYPVLVGIQDTPYNANSLALISSGNITKAIVADGVSGLQTITFRPSGTVPTAFSAVSDTVSATLTLKVPPSIQNVTYDASTGILKVTGQGMNPGDIIDVRKLTVKVEPDAHTGMMRNLFDLAPKPNHTLTSADVSVSSDNAFSITLNATDQNALKTVLPGNGSYQFDHGFYFFNLSAAANWYNRASTADLGTDWDGYFDEMTGNGITVINFGMAPSAATKLIFGTQPAASVSGLPMGTQPVVWAVDADNKIVPSFNGDITLSLPSGGQGSLTGKALTVSAVNGVANFNGLTFTATSDQQTFTLTANATGLTAASSSSNNSDVVATRLEYSTQPAATLTSGTNNSFGTVPVVRALDANGQLDTGFNSPVTLRLTDPVDSTLDGSVTAMTVTSGDTDSAATTVTVNAVNGVATFTGLALNYTNSGTSNKVALVASSTGNSQTGALTAVTSSTLVSKQSNTPATLSDKFTTVSNKLPLKTGVGTSLDFIQVTDPDSPTTLSVTVSATGATLNGLVDSDSVASGIQISGSVNDVSMALAKAQVLASSPGAASIAVSVSDGVQPSATSTTYLLDVSNDAPLFNKLSTFTGATEDNAFALSFADLLKASDAVDIGGSVEAFAVQSVFSGALTINGSAWNASTNHLIKTGDKVVWTPSQGGNALEAFSVVAQDNLGTNSDTRVPVFVNVTGINDAPVISGSYTFSSTNEDSTGTAVRVSTLLSGTVTASDDEGASIGIAVSGASAHGQWQYSLNSTTGTNGTWLDVGAVSATESRLLPASSWLRYAPDQVASETSTLTVRAWDGTEGIAGGLANTNINGSATAFSASSITLTQAVTNIEDPLSLTLSRTANGNGVYPVTYPENASLVLDSNLKLDDPDTSTNLTGARVLINSGFVSAEDRLKITGVTGTTSGSVTTYTNISGAIDASYDNSTGVMTFSGSGTEAEYQAAMRLATYENISNNPSTGARQIDMVAGTMMVLNLSDGPHFYEYVSGDVTWTAARDGAAARVYAGMTGYLATITSETENNYLATRLSSNGWIGASDATATWTKSDNTTFTTSEGIWKWVTGPEAGTQISNGATAVNGAYVNWETGEPNNFGSGEDYAQMRQTTTPSGKWNDVAINSTIASNTNAPRGYLVEYSGVSAISFSKTLELTPQQVNDAPVLSSASPTLSTVNEDAVTNNGQLVSALNSSITDADTGAVLGGIAITSLKNGNGTWQFRLNNTGNWTSIDSASDSNALLLRPADAVRFLPNAKNATTANFQFRAWDQSSGSAGSTADASSNGGTSAFSSTANTASITVTAVNDAPVWLIEPTGFTFTNITRSDADNLGQSVSALIGSNLTDVDLNATAGIAISASTVVGTGKWQYLTSGSTWSDMGVVSSTSALLLSSTSKIRYVPDGTQTDTVSASISLMGWDGTSGTAGNKVSTATNGGTSAFSSTSRTGTIEIKGVTLSGISSDLTFTEGATLTPGNGVTLSDSGTLTSAQIQIVKGFSTGDQLVLPAGSYGGITGSYNSTTGVLSLTGSASTANYQSALQAVQFTSNDDPTALTPARTLAWFLGNTTTSAAYQTVTLTALNDAPSMSVGSTNSFTEAAGPTALNPDLTLTDADDVQIASASVTISSGLTTGDLLALSDTFADTYGISASYSTGVLSLTGSAKLADYQAVLRAVTFNNTTGEPNNNSTAPSRTITYSVIDANSDGAGAATGTATATLNVTAVNAAPVLESSAAALAYTEGDAAAAIDNTLTLSDADDSHMSGATVSISAGRTSGDVLAVATQNGISGTYNSSTGVLTLTGNATTANYQTALRSVTYESTSADPTATAATRTISWKAVDANSDGAGAQQSQIATTTVKLTATATAPVLTPSSSVLTYTENNTVALPVSPGLSIADGDDTQLQGASVAITSGLTSGDALSFTGTSAISGRYDEASGILKLSGVASLSAYETVLRSVQFSSSSVDPTAIANSRTLTWKVIDNNSDGLGAQSSTAATAQISVAGVNQAPRIDLRDSIANDYLAFGPTGTHIYNNDKTSGYRLGDQGGQLVRDIMLSDQDSAQISGATVTISAGLTSGDVLAVATQNGISGTYISSTGVLTLIGNASLFEYQEALRSVTFSNPNNDANHIGSRTLSWTVSDSASAISQSASSTLMVSMTTPPPSVAFNPIATDNFLNSSEADAALTISGTSAYVENGQSLALFLNGQIFYAEVVNNAWSVNVPRSDVQALPEGNVLISAKLSNSMGYEAPPATAQLTIDKTAPVVKLDRVMTDNRINLAEATAGVIVSGVTDAEPGQALTISLGNASKTVTVQGPSAISEQATWTASFSASDITADAVTPVVILVKDKAGNSGELQRMVEVDRVAPTLTNFADAVAKGNQSGKATVTLADLKAQGNEADTEGTVEAFVVTAISSGTLKIGATESAATNWAAGSNDTVDDLHNAYWTRSGSLTGTLNAFTVLAQDSSGNNSTAPVQAKVSLPAVANSTVLNGQSTWISVDAGLTVSNVSSGAVPNTLPRGVKMPLGDVAFEVSGLSNGGTATVTLAVDSSLRMGSFFKQNLITNAWQNVATSVTQKDGKTYISFPLTDGGPFDSDRTINGVVVDPGGTGQDALTPFIAENTTLVSELAGVLDLTGLVGAVSYAISGGADGNKFSIDASTGVVRFANAPDYETPTDLGETAGNNTYTVQVRASGATSGSVTQSMVVTVFDDTGLNSMIGNMQGGASGFIPSGAPAYIDVGDYPVVNTPAYTFANGYVLIQQLDGTTDGTFSFDASSVTSGADGDGDIAAGDDVSVYYASRATVDAVKDGQIGRPLLMVFNGSASVVDIEGILINLMYTAPTAGSRTYSMTFNDGTQTHEAVTFTMNADATAPTAVSAVGADTDQSSSYSAGDTITLNFSEPIPADLALSNIAVNNSHNFGSSASLTPVAPTSNNFASSFEITLGSSPTVRAADTLTVTQSVLRDTAGNVPTSNLTFTLASANSVPTLTSFAAAIGSVSENTQATITLNNLKQQGNEADINGGTVEAFVVKALSTGSLKIGTSASSAGYWSPGINDIVDATHNAYWTPSSNSTGTLNAFTVVAKDNEGAESATPVSTTMNVTVVNNVPPPPPPPPPSIPDPEPQLPPAPVPLPILIDGASGTSISVTTGTQITTIQTITPVSATRTDDRGSANSSLADIPLAIDTSGAPVVQVGLPVGVGLTATASTSVSGANPQTLREQLIAASSSQVTDSAQLSQIVANGIDQYVPTVTSANQVTIRTIALTTVSISNAPSAPIHITGALGAGEGDTSHPLRHEALVIDTSHLPSGSQIVLDNVEFAVIVGAVTVSGGAGRNYVIGDNNTQTIILGADDDILHGGGGDDIVGSRSGDDQLYGDEGNDLLIGGVGNDVLNGGVGNDVLQGGSSDAGTWTFGLDAAGKMHANFTAKLSIAAQSLNLELVGTRALPAGLQTIFDNRFSLVSQDEARVSDIALLYHAVLGTLPDANWLASVASGALTVPQLSQIAYDHFAATPGVSAMSLENQINALVKQVWGHSDEAVTQLGLTYFKQGGTWKEALLYLANSAESKKLITDTQGLMSVSQPVQLKEAGWAANSGNDQLLGGNGMDLLIGGSGNDLLDGGAGIDMASFFGAVADYSVGLQVNASGITEIVLKHVSSGDVDTLRNVELFQFGGAVYGPKEVMPNLSFGEFKPVVDYVKLLGTADLQALGIPSDWV